MKKPNILSVFAIYILYSFFIISCEKDPVEEGVGAHAIDADRAIPYSYPNWMADIEDTKYLSEITIPGAHDCGADLHTSAQGTMSDVTIAQDFRISNQLMLGVRWFDIRLNDDEGTMTVYHGSYYLHKNFNDLVRPALDFLTNHPTETLIFMIKQENSSRSDDAFGNGVLGYLNWSYPDRFWMGDYIPKLSEVRGKIVITRQFWGTHGYAMGVPLLWNDNTTGSFGSSDNGIYVYVQDHYSLNTVIWDTKISEIENCITKAHNEPYPYRCYYLNFTSGEATASLVRLQAIAAYINPRINTFLLSKPTWYNCGVIFVNFAGGSDDGEVSNDLVRTIVNRNEFITHQPQVTIGTQIWTSQNLTVKHYRNGDPIYHCTSNAEWASLTTGAYCYYDNDSAGITAPSNNVRSYNGEYASMQGGSPEVSISQYIKNSALPVRIIKE
ncbi:MAG: phosphatidylinositol-specific phospholipase C domain-containing protein [Bacteroidota bacterium]